MENESTHRENDHVAEQAKLSQDGLHDRLRVRTRVPRRRRRNRDTRQHAVVYFSKTGNTRKVAETIRALTGADLYEVTTKEPYPEEYGPTTEIVKEEIEKGIEREIVAPKMDLSKYDVVILGTPTWWHHVAQALQTWIKSVDLKGKTVAHFNTHGGGGRMHTEEDFLKILPDNKHLGHLTIRGSAWGLEGDVRDWLKKIGLL